ncbi:MAG: hypothetical protein ABSF29_09475 [Tepidisphaeraceae bacterium]|jgi:hypothetical protein
MTRQIAVAVALGWLLAGRALADNWNVPQDNVLTESQLQDYFKTISDWQTVNAKIDSLLAQAQTPEAKSAVLSTVDQQYRACLARHNISKAELNWIAQRATEAWDVISYYRDDFMRTENDLDSQSDANFRQYRQASASKAIYESALKEGRRAMSAEDRRAAIQTAQSDEQAALAAARECDEEMRDAAADATRHTADAKAAEALAGNPPDDLSSDELADFIQENRDEAKDARGAAAVDWSLQANLQVAQGIALWEADDAAQIAVHPDIPVTDQEKAAVKAQNQAAIARADIEIAHCRQVSQRISELRAKMDTSLHELQKQVPEQNAELMLRHFNDYQTLFAPTGAQ